MIRMSVFYPSAEGATFDHEYLRDRHVPQALETWGLDHADVERGITGPYTAAVHCTFASTETLGAATVGDGTSDVLNDVTNYTSIGPVVQVRQIVS
jgi:uncharacterized protein (TIGR02118 family)